MSANPEARVDDDEPKTPSAEAGPVAGPVPGPVSGPASEPAVGPGAEAPAEPRAEVAASAPGAEPAAKSGPEPAGKPEPEAVSKPEPAPQPAATLAAAAAAAPTVTPPKPEPEPWKPRRRPEPEEAKREKAEAGEFDAVFEARSETGLGERLTPTITYLLMIIAPVSYGLTAVPAAIIASMSRETAPEWLRSHYLFQLRTFWVGLVMAVAGGGTYIFFDRGPAWVVLGVTVFWGLMLLLTVTWVVLRSTAGLLRLRRGESFRNYRTWTV